MLDPNLVRYYVVLHDGSSGDEAKADEVLAKMKTKLGNTSCAKLVINTMEGEKDESDGMKVCAHHVQRCLCSRIVQATWLVIDATLATMFCFFHLAMWHGE